MIEELNSLSGIQFEDLCKSLLQKAGFEVQSTKQSGDGGIDLIAYHHRAFIKGKYIIQCKRYTGSVGEPIIRDLYGVVMAEHANKGILITTGHFTMSALNFAQNKNLELIDGEELTGILVEYDMAKGTSTHQITHFTQYDCFNRKNMIFISL